MNPPMLDHDTILEAVRHWPREAQLLLARELLSTVATSSAYESRDASPMAQAGWRNLIGLLATEQTPPSDEDVARWREERRTEKYGR